MLEAVLSMDGATVVSVAVKTLVYLASLVAAGSALCLVSLKTLGSDMARAVRRLGVGSTGVAAAASVALIPMGGIFLSGGSWSGATDPVLGLMVLQSPLGESVATRIVGLALLAAFFLGRMPSKLAAAMGASVVCLSFALRGHVLEEPRVVLGALLMTHLLGLAFWIGAFAPLYRMTRHAEPARTGAAAEEFGRKALWVVAALALAGVGLLIILTGNPIDALATTYGRLLALKLLFFVVLLGAAAVNKLRLTPALVTGDTGAGTRLRRSIGLEAAVVCAILVTTAILTTVSSPG